MKQSKPIKNAETYTSAEIQKLTKMSSHEIYKLESLGLFPPRRTDMGWQVRWNKLDVHRWLESNQ